MRLTAQTGTIVRAGEWEGYFIVGLDGPAYYRHADGEEEVLFEIREAEDNFLPIADQR